MKLARHWIAMLALCLWASATNAQLATSTPAPAFQQPPSEAAATVVVYNKIDPLSLDLAGYYAEKRGIPYDHLVGLNCAMAEEISREDYDRTIAEPLRKAFTEHGWWRTSRSANAPAMESQIRYVVLMRGIPLKIAAAANYAGDSFDGTSALNKNEAAVDSELATLGYFTRKISGPFTNPYFRSFTPFVETGFTSMMLVCRLDGPTGQIVRGMIDDSLYAEKHGLWGFAYIDQRGMSDGSLIEGDQWLGHLAEEARTHGVPVIVDRVEAQFADDYPMRSAALYFGWYGENVSGVFAHENFRFNKGAIAVHIHSFSGATVRDPHQHWVAPLLARGAAATLGNVYEPYLALTPNLDVFYDRLANGFNFAESAYASVRTLSWMNTFVGDPLYRPFKVIPDDDSGGEAAAWSAYREGALAWFGKGRAAGEAKLQQTARKMRSGIIFEGMGLLQRDAAHDSASALASFEQAQLCYPNPSDVLRVVIHRVQMLREAKQPKLALALAQKTIKAFPAVPATNVLRSIVDEMVPKPPPSPSH